MREGAADLVLAWYDAAGRDLPWRVRPQARAAGLCADPYRVWLSEVMLQQTTVAAVTAYFARFTARWPDIAALAAADDADVMAQWAGLGYYARARNLLACARAVVARGGFPSHEDELRALPGVGPYTAAAIAAIAFDRRAVVVDGNVERVMARLFAHCAPLPAAKPALRAYAEQITPSTRAGDYAQGVMDIGATICTPRSPKCPSCPLARICAGYAAGNAAELPRKQPKAEKPVRSGVIWIWRNEAGDYLLELRPPKGLLGGMLAFPSAGWDGTALPPPARGLWAQLGSYRHTFTHFHADMQVMFGTGPANPMRGGFAPLTPHDLPSLMRKALALVPH